MSTSINSSMATNNVSNMIFMNQTVNFSLDNESTTTRQEYYDHEELSYIQYQTALAINTICLIGIICNILAIFVLSNHRMRSSTSFYLIAQAVFDTLVLICASLFLATPAMGNHLGGAWQYYSNIYPRLHPVAYPLSLIMQTSTIYITVAFTTERFIAVCHPLQAAEMCTIPRAKKVILCVMICAIIFNIPRMCEHYIKTCVHNNTTYYTIEKTAFGQNHGFAVGYHVVAYILVVFLIPFLLLTILNALLIKAVKRSRKTQQNMNARVQRENNLTIMLIAVIMVFLVCQFPALLDNILVAFLSISNLQNKKWYIIFNGICTNMVVVNSAVNFILYCMFGKKFRRIFLITFKCWMFCPKGMVAFPMDDVSKYTHVSVLRNTSGLSVKSSNEQIKPLMKYIGCKNTCKSDSKEMKNEHNAHRSHIQNKMLNGTKM